MESKPVCQHCGKELAGRTDKRFCDHYCKSAFHNRNTDSKEAFIKEINKKLRRNRSALRYACPQGKATVRKEFLASLGMDFTYFTHEWKSKGGNSYRFCYDYGYTQIDDPLKVMVIQYQLYMDKNIPSM